MDDSIEQVVEVNAQPATSGLDQINDALERLIKTVENFGNKSDENFREVTELH